MLPAPRNTEPVGRLSVPSLSRMTTLTTRERQVLALLGVAYTDKDIQRTLGISFSTTHAHVLAIKRKLRVRQRTHLALIAVAHGLSPQPAPS